MHINVFKKVIIWKVSEVFGRHYRERYYNKKAVLQFDQSFPNK